MKNQIREQNKIKRRAMSKAEVAEKSNAVAKAFLQSELYKNAQQIMVYLPLGNETNTSEIISASFRDGKSLILPVTDSQSGVITPCIYEKDTVLVKGAFSVTEPNETIPADMARAVMTDFLRVRLWSKLGFVMDGRFAPKLLPIRTMLQWIF